MSGPRFPLEVWLIGTPAELDAATDALAQLGRTVTRGRAVPLAGADTGRARCYLLLTLPIHAAAPAATPTTARLSA
jgi:hypothetical protein